MSTIFPLSASAGQVFDNRYTFDGTSWNINGIVLTENYLEESSASATYLNKVSASNTYQTSLSVGTGLTLNSSTVSVNPGAMLNQIVGGTSGNSYGLVGTSSYLDVKDTNGYNKEIELDISAVESQLVTDGFLTNSSASTTYATKSGGTFSGNIIAPEVRASTKLVAQTVGGDEGGEILLGKAATNTTLAGDGITIDVYQNRLRIFEQGGDARGGYLDVSKLANGVGTNLVPGLVQVIPTSISVGSGSGTVSSGGAVTFSGSTSVSINGCFTSQYDNYRIVCHYEVANSGGSNPYMRLRQSGSDDSLSNYVWSGRRMISWGGASTDMFNSGMSYLPLMEMYNGNNINNSSIDLINPNKSLNTGYIIQSHMASVSNGGNYGHVTYGGTYRGTKQFDGFTFNFVDTNSGTIRIYGYNNGGA